jgi:predicted nucleotidyltransferase
MLSALESFQYYRMVGDLRTCFTEASPDFVRSVFLYGSASRFEVMPGISDLDIMVVLYGNVLNIEHVETLSRISEQARNRHPIHMTFRIRSELDMQWSSSGATDFGPSSLLNYLRDSWYLYGEDLDDILLTRLRNCDEQEATSNLRLRLSEIRKRVRGLISVRGQQKSATNMSAPINVGYEIGDTLVEFAEVLCYQHGCLFACAKQSLCLARELTGSELFSKAISWKKGQPTTHVETVIAEMDALLEQALAVGGRSFHYLLGSLIFERFVVAVEQEALPFYQPEVPSQWVEPLREEISVLLSCTPKCDITSVSKQMLRFAYTEVQGAKMVKLLIPHVES